MGIRSSEQPSTPAATETPVHPRHRPEIDGLRAAAVVLVALYHAGVPAFDAGFIGVDIFFVISGFLITGLILEEIDRTSRISIWEFWGRRIRRLSPALTVMVLAVLVASLVWYSPLRWGGVAVEAGASSLYVSNLLFAARSTGYFAQGPTDSPLLHTWSLSVEEQFYLLWPLALSLIAVLCNRLRCSVARSLRWLVPIACLGSFVLSLVMTERGSPWAYLSLPTRWWEIGVGAGVAVWLGRRDAGVPLGGWLAAAGAGGVGASLVLIGPTTPYPGVAALMPAGAAALLLAAGTVGPVQRWLGCSPARWIGRHSYSWYLWHWPVLAFAVAAGAANSTAARVGWVLASLAPAALSLRFVESPLRFSRRLSTSARPSLVMGAGCVAVVLIFAGVTESMGRRALQDPFLRELSNAVASREADLSDGCERQEQCTGSGPLVMLIGDSHAAHWAPAVTDAVETLGGRVVVRTRGGCPPWQLEVAVAGTDRPSDACSEFRRETDELLEDLAPDVVIVSSGNYSGRLLGAEGSGLLSPSDESDAWRQGVSSYLGWLSGRSDELAVILDNPYVPFDPIECLGRTRSPAACQFDPGAVAEVARDRATTRDAAARAGVSLVFDPAEDLCRPECVTWRGGPVFTDRTHLAQGYVESQTSRLAGWLSDAIADHRN